ncbi:hypothetical protein PPERSA_08533 [Pseudocohnilembus persalinus]|uniref:Uncharacterized protein n=1 Tax=Pseudocohnilembus persalinus TaxID=266149 RepID=A0A0V0R6M2_PSEPJ|nr:hypothetical protein PPERSA_08533 [Pseudocohnilembus persalinus]|eukprot:KRX10130.1 hypothetical protein PPERSA_08533 [Pseudocohnilembus persalinus]
MKKISIALLIICLLSVMQSNCYLKHNTHTNSSDNKTEQQNPSKVDSDGWICLNNGLINCKAVFTEQNFEQLQGQNLEKIQAYFNQIDLNTPYSTVEESFNGLAQQLDKTKTTQAYACVKNIVPTCKQAQISRSAA